MKLKTLLTAACLILSLSCIQAATRRALVIGIGKQQDMSWPKINGDKDISLVLSLLHDNSFTDIRTLRNEQATKDAIMSELNALAGRCSKGDDVYIHFSGHGQLMTDTSGDEKDGWDECWIPYDAFMRPGVLDYGEKHITDDEISAVMTTVRKKVGSKASVVIVVDACHSGDQHRSTYTDPEEEEVFRGAPDKFIIPDKATTKTKAIPEKWLTLSACESYQVNQEMKNGYGKLTYIIYKLWKSLRGKDNGQVKSAITGYMQRPEVKGRLVQTPVLAGNISKYSFSDIFK